MTTRQKRTGQARKASRPGAALHAGTWQVQEAKARLSEVIDRAATEGPQMITRHGKAAAVVLSQQAYEAMKGGRKASFRGLLLGFPKVGEIDIERSRDTGREIEL